MNCKKCGTVITSPAARFCPKCGDRLDQQINNDQPFNINQTVNNTQPKNQFPHDISAIWPEWELEQRIGKGSYGVVYKAVRRDSGIESFAAIKIVSIPTDEAELDSLLSELTAENSRKYLKDVVDEFVGEIRLMESLKGTPNIVSVEDYKVVEKTDSIGWDIFIRMELLTPFNNYCKGHSLSEAEVLKLGADICTALEICQKRNVIHRDIKPENIFMNDFGYFKLGDFGIARKLENMSAGLSQKGTYNYMAPEVARGSVYDARVDIYSLGVVLYRLLNNNMLPFITNEAELRSPNARRLAVERRINGEIVPPPCNASPETVRIILRACNPDPNYRFANPTEMKMALLAAGRALVSNNSDIGFVPDFIAGTNDFTGQSTGSFTNKTADTSVGTDSADVNNKTDNGTTEKAPEIIEITSEKEILRDVAPAADEEKPSCVDVADDALKNDIPAASTEAINEIVADIPEIPEEKEENKASIIENAFSDDDGTIVVNEVKLPDVIDDDGTIRIHYAATEINEKKVVNDTPPADVTTNEKVFENEKATENKKDVAYAVSPQVPEKEEKASKKGIVIAISAILAALLIVGGIVLFVAFGGDKSEESTTEEITTSEETTEEETTEEEALDATTEAEIVETTEEAETITDSYIPTYATTKPYVPATTSPATTSPPPTPSTTEPVVVMPTFDWGDLD